MQLPTHGANPHTLYKSMGMTVPTSIIDFSENSNPLGPPSIVKERWIEWQTAISYYPDPGGNQLREKIASFHDVQPDQVLLGNGAAELMMVTARLFQGKKVGVIHPAFSEYEKVIRVNGGIIQRFYTTEEINWVANDDEIMSFLAKGHALFLCNPSNPTGLTIPRETLKKWLDQAIRFHATILLDEAFIDMIGEEHSMTDYVGRESLLIFRSMTKMYSIAGLRLGYMLGEKSRIAEISELLPHWNVNALSLLAGAVVLEDESFRQTTKAYIKNERTRIFEEWKKLGFTFSNSATNYYLLQPPHPAQTEELFKWLLKHGFVLRHTHNYEGLDGRWLRVGIKTIEQNDRLIQAVKAWTQEQSLL